MVSTSEWRQAGSFFKHKGHNIFWREGGNPSGPVLLPVKLIGDIPERIERSGAIHCRRRPAFVVEGRDV
jgi:hypothetical protein